MKLRPLICAAALAAWVTPGTLNGQPIPWDSSHLYERLGLTEQQKNGVQDVVAREDRVIRESQAEMNVNKAQLEKLLLSTDPDMGAVERLLRATMEWKVKSELAEIRRRVEVRRILGEPKWEQLLRAWRARVRAQKTPPREDDARDKTPRRETPR